MHTSRLVALAFVAAAGAPLAVRAADVESLPDGASQQGQVAQQCLADLRAFEDELAGVGFGVLAPTGYGTGYGSYGMGYGMSGTPRQKMQSLRDAAYVYAFDGDEQSCQTVLASMRQVYQEHQKLVGPESDDPDARRTWRRAHLAHLVGGELGEHHEAEEREHLVRHPRQRRRGRLGRREDARRGMAAAHAARE